MNNCETRFFNSDSLGFAADEIYADGIKSIEQDVFNYETYDGKNIRLKNLEAINYETNIFGEYPVERIEFSNLKTTTSLPMNEGAKIAMPSTFTECTEDTNGRNYLVYGTSGTYAEAWAKENNHTFMPISQGTAIMNELDSEYYGWGELEFDVIGFNKNYTWYGCYDEYGKNAVALTDEINGKFNPLDYEAYPYYYCICTSTDGNSVVEIKSRVSKNIDYAAPKYSVDALGGSIRVTDAGMRFGFSLDKAQNADVEEYGFVYSFERTGELKAGDENVYTTTAPNRIDHGENITFNLVFTSVPPEAYDQIASARAYIKVDGEYYYSPILQRSFNQISNAVLNDDEIDEATKNALRSLFVKEGA